MPPTTLAELGWDTFFEGQLRALGDPALIPGRVVGVERTVFDVCTQGGVIQATPAGRFRYDSEAQSLPTVGDWVAMRPIANEAKGVVRNVLARKTHLSRTATSGRDPSTAGLAQAQVLVANIDVVFVVTALDYDFSVRRIERYVAAVQAGGAVPVLLLNKTDLCDDVQSRVDLVKAVAPQVAIHPLSAVRAEGVAVLASYLRTGTTTALIGSSGVGKSTLINRLLESNVAPTGAVREADSKGRHTTSWRELFVLPGGGVLIDNPGLREIGVWASEVGDAFADIETLAQGCQYRNCTHHDEPGCAVQAAVAAGKLEPKRLLHHRQLVQEASRVATWMSTGERQRKTGRQRRAGIKHALRAKGKTG